MSNYTGRSRYMPKQISGYDLEETVKIRYTCYSGQISINTVDVCWSAPTVCALEDVDIQRFQTAIGCMRSRPSCDCLDEYHHWDFQNTLSKTSSCAGFAFAGFLEQICPLEFTLVVGLPGESDSVQSVLKSLARAGVYHASLSDVSRVGWEQ